MVKTIRNLVVTLALTVGALSFHAPANAADSVSKWKATALSVGWKESEWRWLSCVIRRESNGQAGAVGDRGTSYGLTQIHVPAHRPLLREMGLRPADLKNGRTNLKVARKIYLNAGKAPWRSTRKPC
jgi:hypothetical protein